jgi:FkbM family methyltransferase
MEFDEIAFLEHQNVSHYFDVGANIGQTGKRLRNGGFLGQITSFEPIPSCFETLKASARMYPDWDTHNCALGDAEGMASIGVSQNLVSSSIRSATEKLIRIHEPVRYMTHVVAVRRLDALIPQIIKPEDHVYLKVDTQGFERNVIVGAGDMLSSFAFVRLEVAVREVYVGEMELPEAISMMAMRGFTLIEAWPAWRHPATNVVLHFDLLFQRDEAAV